MAFNLHPIICTWNVVTTCISVTVFFPLGVWLCSKKREKENERRGQPQREHWHCMRKLASGLKRTGNEEVGQRPQPRREQQGSWPAATTHNAIARQVSWPVAVRLDCRTVSARKLASGHLLHSSNIRLDCCHSP